MILGFYSNAFPSLSTTFIYREALELRRRGFVLKTYSVWPPKLEKLSADALAFYRTTYYVLPLRPLESLRAHLHFFLKSPVRYLTTLGKMVFGSHHRTWNRVRSTFHFFEGVILARRMVLDGVSHVHAHFASQATSVARVVYLLTGIPYSFGAHAHDIWHDRILQREKVAEAVFVTVCSKFGRDYLLRLVGQDLAYKLSVVYHGVDLSRFPLQSDSSLREPNLIVAVGRLTDEKGYPDLLRACRLLEDQQFPFRCVIVGDGFMRQELQQMVKALGVGKRVEFTGALPQEEVVHWYRRGWVFCLPCRTTGDGRHDAIPNVLLEAMASGIPAISTDNTAQSEVIRDGVDGLLVRPESPQEVAVAIRRLCTDPELWRNVVRNARQRVEQEFDNRQTLECLLTTFERTVGGARRPS